jgi:hypothetical protein
LQIYFAGHGGPGLLLFPNDYIDAPTLRLFLFIGTALFFNGSGSNAFLWLLIFLPVLWYHEKMFEYIHKFKKFCSNFQKENV